MKAANPILTSDSIVDSSKPKKEPQAAGKAASPAGLISPSESERFGAAAKWKLSAPKSALKSKFLVVDDEETIGIGISELLKDVGFDAAYVLSGQDAVEAIKKTGYNVIFMDMIMPGMNGLETFREIKKVMPDARVILFTGYFKEVEFAVAQGVREGMIDEFIRKPYFASEIIKSARKYA